MRGSKNKDHISGAENIVREEDLEQAASLLIKRALSHTKGKSDFINLKIEAVDPEELTYLEPLEVTKIEVDNHKKGFEVVKFILNDLGIQSEKADKIINLLKDNPNMRGAILLDINTMQRLEPDTQRGIRATYMDFEGLKINHLSKDTKYNSHFTEALALATKVANSPNIIGEICYSDDPNYTAGYIASKKFGYVRISEMKEMGDEKGGRVFLYDSNLDDNYTVQDCIDYIQDKKIIIRDNIKIKNTIKIENYIQGAF